ncbi:MAG: S-layer homology domain-containing protein [Truepera sp.]|nr:S-layer homology domain-containing protein [Truepera sp.]
MRKVTLGLLSLALLLASTSLGQHATEPHFADVPPCHWAAEAVNRLAGQGIFIGFPPEPAYDSVNALRQVFEGLLCADPAWSLRFLEGAPVGFGEPPAPRLVGFELASELLELTAEQARIAFTVALVLDEPDLRRLETRHGEALVRRDGVGWRVSYASLAGLEPTLFPPGSGAAAESLPVLAAIFKGE